MNNHLLEIKNYFNSIARQRDDWKKKNKFYHDQMKNFCSFVIPAHKKVIEIGCGTGDLLAYVKPSYGVGVDIAENLVDIAKKKYPKLNFFPADAQNLSLNEAFDYIIASDLIGNLEDVQKAFEELRKISSEKTRIIITYQNNVWEPILTLAEKLKIKMPQPKQNWLSRNDIENLLELANLDVIKKDTMLLVPIYIPLLSNVINKYFAKLPVLKSICLVQYFIVRQKPVIYSDNDYSVSLIIPARNEAGNIEQAVLRIPKLGTHTELIFVEGHSKDNTLSEIKRVIKKYKNQKDIVLVDQGKGVGKGNAVRNGFHKARCDIVMILDADLTMPPEDLPKFYDVLRTKKAEFTYGSRLVYPMEKEAMRFLNMLGNKFFSIMFTWLLGQPVKDTLCGTKAIFRKDYYEIERGIEYFGDFDPFGDFDLIFGASKLNLKMLEIPIRYRTRTYGNTNISRFRHGLLLLKMTIIAAKKLKFT